MFRNIVDENSFDSLRREIFSRAPRDTILQDRETSTENILIIGLGGIGSWVGMFKSKSNRCRNIFLLDDDTVDTSNIGRTPFTVEAKDELKVEFIASMISLNNPCATVYPIPYRMSEEFIDDIVNAIVSSECGDLIAIDCRDNDFSDYEMMYEKIPNLKKIFRVAYNRFSVTLDFKKESRTVLGNRGYEVVPSHVFPAAMAALIALQFSEYYMSCSQEMKEKLDANSIRIDSLSISDALFFLNEQSALDGAFPGQVGPAIFSAIQELIRQIGSRQFLDIIRQIATERGLSISIPSNDSFDSSPNIREEYEDDESFEEYDEYEDNDDGEG